MLHPLLVLLGSDLDLALLVGHWAAGVLPRAVDPGRSEIFSSLGNVHNSVFLKLFAVMIFFSPYISPRFARHKLCTSDTNFGVFSEIFVSIPANFSLFPKIYEIVSKIPFFFEKNEIHGFQISVIIIM